MPRTFFCALYSDSKNRLSFLARLICSALETIMYQAKTEKTARTMMMIRPASVARPHTNCNCVSAKKQTGTLIKKTVAAAARGCASWRNVEELNGQKFHVPPNVPTICEEF